MVTILSVQVRQQTCLLTLYPGHDKIRLYGLITTERAAGKVGSGLSRSLVLAREPPQERRNAAGE